MNRIFNETRRRISLMSRIALAAVFLAGLLGPLIAGTLPTYVLQSRSKELERVPSADLRYDAVLVEYATLGPRPRSWQVRIVRHGLLANHEAPIFSARGLVNPKMVWRKARLLEVDYDRARIDHFTSVWTPSRNEHVDPVEVRLGPSAAEFSYLQISQAGLARLPEEPAP